MLIGTTAECAKCNFDATLLGNYYFNCNWLKRSILGPVYSSTEKSQIHTMLLCHQKLGAGGGGFSVYLKSGGIDGYKSWGVTTLNFVGILSLGSLDDGTELFGTCYWARKLKNRFLSSRSELGVPCILYYRGDFRTKK